MTTASLAAQYRLFLLALVAFITLATTIPTRAAERPNIIFILADDKYAPDASQPRKGPDLWCFNAVFTRMSSCGGFRQIQFDSGQLTTLGYILPPSGSITWSSQDGGQS